MSDPQQPQLPEKAPQELRDFVSCKVTSVALGGRIDWLPLPIPVDVTVRAGATPGSAIISIGFPFGSVDLPASIGANGQLEVDTSGLPMGREVADAWVRDLNAWLRHNGQQFGPPGLGDGKVTLTKVPVATQPSVSSVPQTATLPPALVSARERAQQAEGRLWQLNERWSIIRSKGQYDADLAVEIRQAGDEERRAREEVARLEAAAAAEPAESILDELGPEAEHAPMMAGIASGEGQTSEQAVEEARRRNNRTALALVLAGSLAAFVVFVWLLGQQGGLPTVAATPTPAAAATVAAPPSPTLTPPPTARPTTTVPPAAVVTPSPTPEPQTAQLPTEGSSLAVALFSRSQGSCFAERFTAGFDVQWQAPGATVTQLPNNHVSTGTLERTGPAEGVLVLDAEGQHYDLAITGNSVVGTYRDTTNDCDELYDVVMRLDRPFLAPPPYGTAPLAFEFLSAGRPALQPMPDRPLHIVVASLGEPNVTQLLPITLTLYVDGEMSDLLVIPDEPGLVCRGPTGCSADAPELWAASLLRIDTPSLLVASGPGGDVLAVYAPNGLQPDFLTRAP